LEANHVEIIDDPQTLASITAEILGDTELLAAAEEIRDYLVIYLEHWLEDDTGSYSVSLIRDTDGRISSFRTGTTEGDIFHSGWILTRVSKQGGGLYKKIAVATIDDSRRRGLTEIRATVAHESLGPALIKMGFTSVPNTINYTLTL